MHMHLFRRIVLSTIPVFFLSVLLSTITAAQDTVLSDEQLIRNLLDQMNTRGPIPLSDSFIRVFPDLPYPFVGHKRTPAENQLLDEVRKERSNEIMTRSPLRIVISDSKDLAYVYGSYTVDFDNLQHTHIHREGSFIIICRKVNGQWMIDVSFNRYNKT